jgi:catechol 2,3-dioxygenase-like lactoylglutathione lyase family enzyme
MSPAERPLESAVNDHVALSVGDLDTMTAFYTRLGFDEIARSDFAPAPVRTAMVRNLAGMALELTAHQESAPGPLAAGPVEAARRRGLFHFALHVSRLDHAVTEAVAAGAQLVSGPAPNSRGDVRFAYVRDPEGNLIELVSPEPKTDSPLA